MRVQMRSDEKRPAVSDFASIPNNKLLKTYAGLLRGERSRRKSSIEVSSPQIARKEEPSRSSKEISPASPLTKSAKDVVTKNAEGVPVEAVKARRPIVSGGSGKKRILEQGKERVVELINPNKLRIVGGVAKGKKINSPEVYLRPMMSKVREALFSTLEFMEVFTTIGNNATRVLDTFCGSGSVGLESLSRGAAFCCFVDLSPDCTRTAMANLETCGFPGQGMAVSCRTEEILKEPLRFGVSEPFNLITITPPYEEVVYSELIDAVCNSPLVTTDTVVVIEYPVEMGKLPFILGGDKLYGVRNRKYGRTVLGIYVYRPSRKFDMRPEEFAI